MSKKHISWSLTEKKYITDFVEVNAGISDESLYDCLYNDNDDNDTSNVNDNNEDNDSLNALIDTLVKEENDKLNSNTSINDLINDLKENELSHLLNSNNIDNDILDIITTNKDSININNVNNNVDENNKTLAFTAKREKKILNIRPIHIPPNRINAQTANWFVKRSFHDQFLLEKAWFLLGNKILVEETSLPVNLLEDSNIIQIYKSDAEIKTVEKGQEKADKNQEKGIEEEAETETNKDKRMDIADRKVETEDENMEDTNSRTETEKGDKDTNNYDNREMEYKNEEIKDKEEETKNIEDEKDIIKEIEDLTICGSRDTDLSIPIYMLNDNTYIFAMGKDNVPGTFIGLGNNDDFCRPIEAIELFRLPSWSEHEYSYKLIFSPETSLISTKMVENGPSATNDILPCGLEILDSNLYRIHL